MIRMKNGGVCLNRRYSNAEQKERIRQRVRVQIDEENYQFFPERKDPDYYDNDVNQRVGVYVRVSTDDPRQTTSYELQKKYYSVWYPLPVEVPSSMILSIDRNP